MVEINEGGERGEDLRVSGQGWRGGVSSKKKCKCKVQQGKGGKK